MHRLRREGLHHRLGALVLKMQCAEDGADQQGDERTKAAIRDRVMTTQTTKTAKAMAASFCNRMFTGHSELYREELESAFQTALDHPRKRDWLLLGLLAVCAIVIWFSADLLWMIGKHYG